MTGREAIQFVCRLPLREAARLRRQTGTDATLKLVCGWRLDEPSAFRELATLVVRSSERGAFHS